MLQREKFLPAIFRYVRECLSFIENIKEKPRREVDHHLPLGREARDAVSDILR
jgi:hypothetical protein